MAALPGGGAGRLYSGGGSLLERTLTLETIGSTGDRAAERDRIYFLIDLVIE